MEPTLIDPRAIRAASVVRVDFGDGTGIDARKMDVAGMLLEGFLPQPLLNAAQRLVDHPALTVAERIELLESEVTDDQVLQTLRRYAVTVAVTPVVVDSDDGHADHMPVTLLTSAQLLAIWNQTAVLPRVGAAQAAHFRRRTSTVVSAPVHPRQDVQPAAVDVDESEFRTG